MLVYACGQNHDAQLGSWLCLLVSSLFSSWKNLFLTSLMTMDLFNQHGFMTYPWVLAMWPEFKSYLIPISLPWHLLPLMMIGQIWVNMTDDHGSPWVYKRFKKTPNVLLGVWVQILPNSCLITLTSAAVDDDDGAYMSRNDGWPWAPKGS